jgi:uncharacterized repeat protein (TIGR01451 family)
MSLNLTDPNLQSSGTLQDASGQTLLFSLTNYLGGSGGTTSFLRLRAPSGSSIEKGFNTNGTRQFDTLAAGMRAIRLNNLPTVTIDNTTYYEFRIDLNESNSNPQIDLTKLQIFQSNVANLTGYNEATNQLAGLNPVINLNKLNNDGKVLLNAGLNSGSNAGDVLVYLPRTTFTGNPYIYTYAEFEGADAGFEEFSYGTTSKITPLADLSLTQTLSDDCYFVGDSVTFTVTLTNSGAANATGVNVKNLLPAGFDFTSITPSLGTYNSATGIWNAGNLAAGSDATLTLTGVALDAATASAYTNVAEIVGTNQFDPDSSPNNGDTTEDDYTSLLAPVAKLNLDKQFTSVDTTIDSNNDGMIDQFIALPGDEVSFQIKVSNTGFGSACDVVVQDDLTAQLPIGLEVLSLDLDGGINLDTSGGGDGNPQTIEVEFDSIAVGETKTITVNARVRDENITSLNLSGKIGTENPTGGELNSTLPEYYETSFDATLFLNYSVQKETNAGEANFGFLNITSAAEVVSIHQKPLPPGSIADSARLDVSTYELKGVLNNGEEFRALSVENLSDPNPSNLVSLFLNPDPAGGMYSYPYNNHSQFLPPGETGLADVLGEWAKIIGDPVYDAKLAVWMNLQADGDLSNTQDETAVIDALADFVESGVYRRDTYSGGSFAFNNGTQIQKLTYDGGETAPTPTVFVNVEVTDTGVKATSEGGTVIGNFADLQAALDSFNFAEPTGINVTLKDTSGDGAVTTRLQKIGGFNFDRKWGIQTINVASNTTQATFASGNQDANLDFSFENFANSNPSPTFTLRSDNGKDTITGTPFADKIEGLNGTDVLSGFDGNDSIAGGNGKDTINGGQGDDVLTGGAGVDTFIFGPLSGSDILTDYSSQETIDLSKLSLSSSVLDSNSDGVISAPDNLADLIGGNLVLNLASVNGGVIQLTGVTSVNLSAVVL